MDEQYWNDEPNQNIRQQDTYQTGRTHPPKSHGGVIAVLLVAIIFLGGLASAMSVLNIRLTRQLQKQDPQNAMSFYQAPETTDVTEDVPATQKQPVADSDWTLDISKTPEAVPNIPQEGGLSLQEIYRRCIDAVVSITCVSQSGASSGTGVVLSADGYILTNHHVVADARQVEVLFSSAQTLPAEIVGLDEISDLAVLRVQATDLTPAEFGDSSMLQVGDAVVAIGDPLGVELRGTMTDGIVSAINRDIATGGRTMTLIQTNAALNSGNSGGPLLNCYGQVIGINTLKIGDYMDASGVEGLGFAIPSTTVKDIVDQLLQQGYVSGRPTLGITGEEVSVIHQIYSHLPRGIYITDVTPGSDAAKKGISVGDVLMAVDNTRITDAETLKTLIYQYQPGDTVKVVIYRAGSQYALELTVGESA